MTIRHIVPCHPHHVVTRGNNRRRLFSHPQDYLRFLSCLARALEKTECALNAVTMMPNHTHMIVTPHAEKELPLFVKLASQRYAQVRNRLRRASGKLFEQRYWCRVVTSEEQVAVTTVYVDLNPKRAGIVEAPLDYPWSTYPIHAGRPEASRIPMSIWTPTDWYLALGRDPAERASHYREFAALCAVEDRVPDAAPRVKRIEMLSQSGYTLRLQRPDGTSARETEPRYGSPVK